VRGRLDVLVSREGDSFPTRERRALWAAHWIGCMREVERLSLGPFSTPDLLVRPSRQATVEDKHSGECVRLKNKGRLVGQGA
jgi:hypothetical protein